MVKTLNITEDILKLIPLFFIQNDDNDENIFIDKKHLLNIGSHLLEDIAFAIGKIDECIPTSIDDSDGRAFPKELEDYMLGLYQYIVDNFYEIETLIHQYVVKGGIAVGIYKCKDKDFIWEKND